MRDDVTFDHENPVTVHDILWSWSTGYLSKQSAIDMLHLDDEMELYEAADDNEVPYPGSPSPRDIEMADEFVSSIIKAA